jgi:hypothetical protein
MLLLSALSFYFDNLNNQAKMTPPEFISMPLLSIERGIHGFVEAMCFQQSSDTVAKAPVPARQHKVQILADATTNVNSGKVYIPATKKV